jgi:hypothetical protein
MLSLASSFGTALGTAILAPFLFKLTSARIVFYVAGVLLFVATTRVLHIYSKEDRERTKSIHRKRSADALRWLVRHPSIATMVGVSVLTGTMNLIMAALAPIYVQDVLDSDPANAVYVMGPAGLAMTFAIVVAPRSIRLVGERWTAAFGLGLVVTALVALGLVEGDLALVLDPFNPLRLLEPVGIRLSADLRTAALLSVPLGLGVGFAENAVKTFIGRRVPLSLQGRTFAVRSTFESGLAIIPLLVLSALAPVIGVSAILVLMPVALYAVVLALLALGRRHGLEFDDPKTLVTKTFWEDSEAPLKA